MPPLICFICKLPRNKMTQQIIESKTKRFVGYACKNCVKKEVKRRMKTGEMK